MLDRLCEKGYSFGMNKLDPAKRAQILGMMVEGMSIRAITRLTGASKNTVAKLLATAGHAALEYQNQKLRNLTCKKVQCDEIWSFVYAKQKNVPEKMQGRKDVGSVWTWTAIDADTKLIPSWLVSSRDVGAAYTFVEDLLAAFVAACRSRLTPTRSTSTRWLTRSEPVSIWLCSTRSMGRTPATSGSTALRSALASVAMSCRAILIPSTSQRATWSARTSRCGCTCADSRG